MVPDCDWSGSSDTGTGIGVLSVGESVSCIAFGTATAGQYVNLGEVVGTPPVGPDVTDSDPSHYFGGAPAIDIEKYTNGENADTIPGPLILIGDAVTWTYVVTNIGNTTLTDVVIADNQPGVTPQCRWGKSSDAGTPNGSLSAGEIVTCTADGQAIDGQYENLGFVSGLPPLGDSVTDSDLSHYLGLSDIDTIFEHGFETP